MASGDVNIYGPFNPTDTTTIDTALTGNVVAADLMVPYYHKGQVYFVVVKA